MRRRTDFESTRRFGRLQPRLCGFVMLGAFCLGSGCAATRQYSQTYGMVREKVLTNAFKDEIAYFEDAKDRSAEDPAVRRAAYERKRAERERREFESQARGEDKEKQSFANAFAEAFLGPVFKWWAAECLAIAATPVVYGGSEVQDAISRRNTTENDREYERLRALGEQVRTENQQSPHDMGVATPHSGTD